MIPSSLPLSVNGRWRNPPRDMRFSAKAKGIEVVVFDRGGWAYHGRVAALAKGAREGGLQF